MLYPFTFKPILKKVIWGGSDICPFKGITPVENGVGESWELSHVEGNYSIVDNGELEGKSLDELIRSYGKELLGEKVMERFGTTFPLLIKFIDARDNLSIQVHPDDELAKKRHNSFGKTEMWYVIKAEKGAGLYSGFSEQIDAEEYVKRVENNTIMDVLQRYDVNEGDVFFLPAGRVHAIGAGCFIAEIQQNSNTTYRVFDYGRLGADGKPRALHVEKALDVARLCPPERPAGPMGKPEQNGDCTSTLLAKCGYFTARLLDVAGSAPLCADGESFHSLLCLSGSGAVICGGGAVPFAKGDSLFLPAGLGAYTIAGRAQLVLTTL